MATKTDERKQFLFDVFITALEGGIGYWSVCERYHWSNEDGTEDHDRFFAVVQETEEEPARTWRIDRSTITRGIAAVTKGEAGVHSDYVGRVHAASVANDAGEIDALDADIIVQAGLFGEVIYG